MKENINNDIESLNSRLHNIENQFKELKENEIDLKKITEIYENYNSVEEITKDVVEAFVEKIIIGNYNEETQTRDVKIKWKYQV